MKNLLSIFLCLFTATTYSQTYKGDIAVGGQVGGGHNKSEYSKYSSIGIAPDMGYFLFHNVLLGSQLRYTYSVNEFNIYPGTLETRHNHHFSFGPLVRYYVPVSPKWRGILHAGYEWYWNVNVDNKETSKNNNYNMGLGAGYFIAENVALEGMFYRRRDQDILFLAGLQVYILRKRSGNK